MRAYAITELPKRIAARVTLDPDTRCWLRQGSTNREDGYGQIRLDGETCLIHRVVYELCSRADPRRACDRACARFRVRPQALV